MDYKGQLYSGELDLKLSEAEEKNMYLRELEKKSLIMLLIIFSISSKTLCS